MLKKTFQPIYLNIFTIFMILQLSVCAYDIRIFRSNKSMYYSYKSTAG